MNCRRIPGNYIHIKQNHYNQPFHDPIDAHIYDNLLRYLNEFIKENHIPNDGLIDICYTDQNVIVVITKNTVAWTETLHNKLCERFNVILNSVEKVELFEPRNYNLNIYYIYITKFHNEDYNTEFSVKFKDIHF